MSPDVTSCHQFPTVDCGLWTEDRGCFPLFSSRAFHHFSEVQSPDPEEIRRAVLAALAEDIGSGDVTTLAVVPENSSLAVAMRAREPLVLAGLPLAESVFRELSSSVRIEALARDGQHANAGETLLRISGDARAILTGERVALNFVQRLSGIATITAQFVDATKGTHAQILDTRKTTPGLRRLEKYAVTCGGGANHRFGLFDMVLIKDNHLAALRNAEPNAIAAAVRAARAKYPQLKIEVEADNLEQVEKAVEAGADLVLLDNMTLVQLRLAVQKCKGHAKTEASGGVNLSTVRAIAETGVDFISAGASPTPRARWISVWILKTDS